MKNQEFDNTIKSLFQECADQIPTPENRYLQILEKIQKEEEKNMSKNKFSSKKVKVIVVAAAICVVSLSCYAGSKINSYVSHGSNETEVTAFADAEKFHKELEFTPKYLERFENGFVFSSANIHETQTQDAENKTIDTFHELSVTYTKDKARCNLNLSPLDKIEVDNSNSEIAAKENDISIYYSQDHYLFVGDESQITDEDRKLEKEGKLYISYGGDAVPEPERSVFSFVTWNQDGVHYQLFSDDESIPKEAYIEMAQELIRK